MRFLITCLAFLFLPTVLAAQSSTQFVKTYCIKCHGAAKQKSERRFDRLTSAIATHEDLQAWQEVLDQLNLSSMPPKDARQPTVGQRAAAVASITRSIADAQGRFKSSGGHAVMRRLNKVEYRHTIGDLLSLNTHVVDPAVDFPAEAKVNGFDNNGQELITSGLLLDHYLRAAEKATAAATHFEPRPESRTLIQQGPFRFPKTKENQDRARIFIQDKFMPTITTGSYSDLVGATPRDGIIAFAPLEKPAGVPASGYYTVRVKAAAFGLVHHYSYRAVQYRSGDPAVLQFNAVQRSKITSNGGQSRNPMRGTPLGIHEVSEEIPRWFEQRVWIDKGYELEIGFSNGNPRFKPTRRILLAEAREDAGLYPEITAILADDGVDDFLRRLHKVYQGPRLRIYEVQLIGPHIDQWPSAGHQRMYGELRAESIRPQDVLPQLRRFTTAAFRPPLRPGDLAGIEAMVQRKMTSGTDPLEALQLGIRTVLCSPGFLYRHEGEGSLDAWQLASRLSYFLWSSTPDQELLKRAADGTLLKASELNRQVDRMLADPRSARFVENFLRVWLNLDSIGEQPPSAEFISYYTDKLGNAMAGETEHFFSDLLVRNGSLRNFIDSDYTFLNRPLAHHYGIKDVSGLSADSFQRVTLKDRNRGGLLGQGSFLTASANGVDTSPVVRGIYLLEKMLGSSVPSPPPDVPEIEPDTRGATTIRQQLIKHREIATCAECHRRIDPLGFALENFDAVGAWRDLYDVKKKETVITAAGQLPTGESFATLADLKPLLLEREDQFARGLVEKMLTYALGRELEITDRPSVDKIVSELAKRGNGLRDLVRLVVLSEAFARN
jgi:hypothetical protein